MRLLATGVVAAVVTIAVGFTGLIATWAIEDATSVAVAGRYEYLGVRLSEAAVMRTNAQTASTRSFLAQKASVLYATSPTELKVTSGAPSSNKNR